MKRMSIFFAVAMTLSISCGASKDKDVRSVNTDEVVPQEESMGSGDAVPAETPAADTTPPAAEAPPAADTTPPEAKTPPPAVALTGKDLYAKYCAACHQMLDKTDIDLRRFSIEKVQKAIQDVPAMQGLKDLTEKDLTAIVDALKMLSDKK